MIIKKLSAKNACNFSTLEVDFSNGITVINGKNKVGKSTILDILVFSVYGNCQKSKKLSYFKKRGSKGNTVTNIVFSFKGKEWEIERTYNGKTSSAIIKVDGMQRAEGAKEVDYIVATEVSPEELFVNSNLSGQKDTSAMLSMSSSNRFKVFKKIFDLDSYQKKADNVKKDLTLVEESVLKSEGTYETLFSQFETKKRDLESIDIADLKNSVVMLETAIAQENSILEKILQEKRNIESSLSSVAEKNKEVEEHNSRILGIQQSVEKLEDNILKTEGKIKEVQIEIDSLIKEKDETTKKVEGYTETISGIVLKRVSTIDSSSITEQESILLKLNNEVSEFNKLKDLAEQGKCPTCHKPTSDIDISDILIKIKEKEKEAKDISLVIYDLKEKQKEGEKNKREQDKKVEEKNSLKVKIDQCENRFKSIDRELKVLQQSIEENKESIKTYELDKSSLVETLKGLTFKEAISSEKLSLSHTRIEKEISTQIDKIKEIQATREGKKELIIKYNILKDTITALEKEIEDIKKNSFSQRRALDVLKEVKLIFEKKLPLFMVIAKLKIIEDESNKFLHKIDSQYTINFKTTSNDTLDIFILDNHTGDESPSENLSGFEETLIGVSIRVGLSYYNSYFNQSPISFIALDEPDKSADESNAEILFKSISELRKEFSQMLIITHKQNVKESFYGASFIDVKKNRETSYIERIV